MNSNKNVVNRKKTVNGRLKITVIGCGACGNGITEKIEEKINELGGDKSNMAFIGINTSTEDLASVKLSHKIHINNSKGAACNRENSIQDLAESIDTILPELLGYIIEDSMVFISTSLGGGTGSAIAPMLAEILLDEGYTVGMIAVLPADNESLKIKDNARQAFYEIEELKPRLGSIFILDNNSTDKISVNKIFASLFSGVMCISNRSQDGNMDLAEIEACLKTPSFSVIAKISKEKGTTANIVDAFNRENNIFAKREDKTISVMGISEAVSAKDSKIDMVELRKSIGVAPTEFHGYLAESGENIIILSGLVMPYTRVDAMTESIQKEADIIKNSRVAVTEVRAAKAIDVFAASDMEISAQNSNKSKGISGLEKLKAKRISK